ncbi:MAG: hypothetical protein ACO1OG_08880 [Devosia sp.]
MWFARLLYFAVPAVLAIASAFGFLLWVFGASAVSNSPLGEAWAVGFWALLLYPATYQGLIIVGWIAMWAKWPISGVLHQLIWAATIVFLIIVAYVGVQFGWIG